MQKFILIFNSEDEAQQAVTRVAILRTLIQMMRLKKEFADHTADIIIANSQLMTLLNTVSTSSKDGIVQACALQVLACLQRHLLAGGHRKDISVLKLDMGKIMDLFEKHAGTATGCEPLVAVMASGILAE